MLSHKRCLVAESCPYSGLALAQRCLPFQPLMPRRKPPGWSGAKIAGKLDRTAVKRMGSSVRTSATANRTHESRDSRHKPSPRNPRRHKNNSFL